MKQRHFREQPIGIPNWALLLFTAVYDELLLHYFTIQGASFWRFLCITLFALSAGFLFAFAASFGRTVTVRRVIAIVISSVCGVACLTEYFVQEFFKTYMSPRSIFSAAGGVVGEYSGTIISIIFNGLWRILLVAAPIVLFCIYNRGKRERPVNKLRRRLALGVFCVVAFLLAHIFALTLSPDKNRYTNEYDFDGAVRGFGLGTGLRLDFQHLLFPGDGEFTQVDADPKDKDQKDPDPTPEPTVYKDNVMNLDFAALAAATKDEKLAAMHRYVASVTPSKQNEYTGLFKGKNLILISAEAFSAEVIDPQMTPTLYRLANKGIKFTDYYQPAWGGSTSTGEYSNVLGLVPTAGVSSMKQTVGHNLYLTMGNQLKRLGYFSTAYHNHTYSYYGRDKTHKNLGYANYIGMGNGMEAGVKPTWPESDQEMMNFTVPQYINKQPFSIYYMTVSGHCSYTTDGNRMSAKNFDAYKDSNHCDLVKGYLAANLELEYAMRDLVNALETAGIADNTVIVLATDHYPYGLDKKETYSGGVDGLSDLYGYAADDVFKRDHSALIIWSGCIEDKNIVVDTPTYSLDIVPTLSNLFGVDYDSRLLVGRDVFSDQMPLALWGNYSWKTDKGTYNASKGKFTPNEGVTVPEDYVKTVSATVRNKIKYSDYVLKNDYFKTLFGANPTQ
mgnify:FL=1